MHLILPSIRIFYKLNNLLTNILTKANNKQQLIVIAVQYDIRKRHFLSVTSDELTQLLNSLQ